MADPRPRLTGAQREFLQTLASGERPSGRAWRVRMSLEDRGLVEFNAYPRNKTDHLPFIITEAGRRALKDADND